MKSCAFLAITMAVCLVYFYFGLPKLAEHYNVLSFKITNEGYRLTEQVGYIACIVFAFFMGLISRNK